MKISFKVNTQKKTKVKEKQTNSCFNKLNSYEEETEHIETKNKVFCLEDGVIKDDRPSSSAVKKKEYCIIVPKSTDWRIKKLKEKLEDGTATDEDKARLELMLESIGEIDKSDFNTKILDNEESADSANGSALEPDYNTIAIEEFGLAFLRGHGWKKEEGIGRKNRKVVPVYISETRPKGHGLGVKFPKNPLEKKRKKTNTSDDDTVDEENAPKLNSKIKILNGKFKDQVGIIKSIDVDNTSFFVELIDRDEIIRISQFAVVLTN